MKNNRNVGKYLFGRGTYSHLAELLAPRRGIEAGPVVFLVDAFFEGKPGLLDVPAREGDLVRHVPTDHEPTTDQIDAYVDWVRGATAATPCAIVGIGGGITMDCAKALANMLTNPGKAEEYQGWDLVRNPAVHKIAVPTLSGTGAEASRTCVLTNKKKGIKLGMNSDHTIYDQVVLDPDLTATVPRNQYFYTGMDAYIHCVESLEGRYRNALADSYSRECVNLCREVFLGSDMMESGAREKLMVASYLGGAAIASTFVGVVHPLSAALSVVFGTHHCVANCIVMNVLDEFYPAATSEFRSMVARQGVEIPRGLAEGASEATFDALYESCIVHEKPLRNALGDDFLAVVTREKAKSLFNRM